MRNISRPQLIEEAVNKLDVNIILVAKFPFHAENSSELTVRKGDILKLLDRPGNGWLLVKFVDKLQPPGYVPASYVNIVFNDLNNPVDPSWLQEQAPQLLKTKVEHCLLHNERYWYRLDLIYTDGSAKFLCKYYSDFYGLHAKLQQHFMQLPTLPQPMQPKPDKMDFNERCIELNEYTRSLMTNNAIVQSSIWTDWIDLSQNTGVYVKNYPECNLSSSEISQNVQPNLTEVN